MIVPLVDGAVSTNADPVAPPAGLLDALGDQLDLAEVYSPPNFLMYENRAWVPVRSVLTAEGAEASLNGGVAALAQADLSGATPVMVAGDHLASATEAVPAGTVHLAVPFDRRWELTVDGAVVESRPAFGTTMAFDVASSGTAVLTYRTSRAHELVVFAQTIVWGLIAIAASSVRFRRPRVRRRAQPLPVTESVFTIDPIIGVPVVPMPTEVIKFDDTDLAEAFVAVQPVAPPDSEVEPS